MNKDYHIRATETVTSMLEEVGRIGFNRSRFINDAIREKFLRDIGQIMKAGHYKIKITMNTEEK